MSEFDARTRADSAPDPDASPAARAFARHVRAVESLDRAALLANFAEGALVQDPVGPSPLAPSEEGHRGRAARPARPGFFDPVLCSPCTVRITQ